MEKYLYQDLYDLEENHWWHISKREMVLEFLKKNPKKGQRILDMGCGTGKNLEFFSKIGEIYGIDVSPEAIEFCKKRGFKNITAGLSNKTNFSRKYFDTVLLLDVLEHVDETLTLNEINRILKDDGTLILTVPALSLLWSKWDDVLHHKRRYSKNELSKVIEQNGFKVVRILYLYPYLVLPLLLFRFFKSLSSNSKYESDFKFGSPLLNSIFLYLSRVQKKILNNVNFPIGTSIICEAKKNENQ